MTDVLSLINEGLKRKGITARDASLLATGKDAAIKNMKAGHAPSFETVEQLFKVLGINLTYAFEEDITASPVTLPLLGYVAAGGDDLPSDTSVTFTASSDNALGTLPAPPGMLLALRGCIFAVQVKGGSMRPSYNDGDRLYAYKDDPARADIERLVGRRCIVTLEDGDAYVKVLRRADGIEPGTWNLESLNPAWPVMVNQRLIEALPVRHVTYRV